MQQTGGLQHGSHSQSIVEEEINQAAQSSISPVRFTSHHQHQHQHNHQHHSPTNKRVHISTDHHDDTITEDSSPVVNDTSLDDKVYVWTYIISDTRHSNNTKRLDEVQNALGFTLQDKPIPSVTTSPAESTPHGDGDDHHEENGSDIVDCEVFLTTIKEEDQSNLKHGGKPPSEAPVNSPDEQPQLEKKKSKQKLKSAPKSPGRKKSFTSQSNKSKQNDEDVDDINITKIRQAVKRGMWTKTNELRMKERYQQVRDAVLKLCKKRNIKTQLSTTDRSATVVHYHEQGNINMYSDENILMRNKIRKDPMVNTIIRHWWEATVKEKGEKQFVSKMTYMSLSMAIYTALMPDDASKTLEDARRNAENDWKVDSNGSHRMNFSLFFDAIFEVADIWCESTNTKEYILFLDILFQKVFLDETLPKIIRKHINTSYTDNLTSKKKSQNKDVLEPLFAKDEKGKESSFKSLEHIRTRSFKGSSSFNLGTPKKTKSKKKIDKNGSPSETDGQTNDEQNITDDDISIEREPAVDILANIPDLETNDSTDDEPIDSIVRIITEDDIDESSSSDEEEHSDVSSSNDLQRKKSFAQNPELDLKVKSMMNDIRSNSDVRRTFVALLTQNDKFVLERTILQRLVSSIKGGKDIETINSPLLGLINQQMGNKRSKSFLGKNAIDPLDLINIFRDMSNQAGDLKKRSSLSRVSSTNSMELSKTKSLSTSQLRRGSMYSSDKRHGLSVQTWSALQQFADDLTKGQIVDRPLPSDEDSSMTERVDSLTSIHSPIPVHPDMRQLHSLEEIETFRSLEYTPIDTPRIQNDEVDRIETQLILESISKAASFQKLFEEGEKLRKEQEEMKREEIKDSEEVNTMKQNERDESWSAYEFFYSNFKAISPLNSARSHVSIDTWWDKDGSSSRKEGSKDAKRPQSSDSSFWSRFGFGHEIDGPWTKEDEKEKLEDIIKQFASSTAHQYELHRRRLPSGSSSDNNLKYRLSKRAQRNLLLIEDQHLSKNHKMRSSWLPKTSHLKKQEQGVDTPR